MNYLSNQIVVWELLPRLHYSYNSCLDNVFPGLNNTLGNLRLSHIYLFANQVYSDTELVVTVFCVYPEGVSILEPFCVRVFPKDFHLGMGQAKEMSVQLFLLDLRVLFYLRVGDRCFVVEHH